MYFLIAKNPSERVMAEEGGSCAYQLPDLRQLSLSGSGSANENTHPPGFTAAPNPFIFIFIGILTFIRFLLKLKWY